MTTTAPIPREDALAFLQDVAIQLHRYGTPSHRLEGALVSIGQVLGHEVAVFCVPTMITIAIGSGGDQRSLMLRVEPGAPDLGRIVRLLEVLRRLGDGRAEPAAALEEIRAVGRDASGLPAWLVIASMGGSGFAGARLFGGGWPEMIAAGVVGTATGAALHLAGRRRERLPLADFMAGAIAAIGAAVCQLFHPLDSSIVAVASLIVLVPGLSLTTAMNELAMRHLVSGTARVLGAGMTLVALGFGAAVGDRIAALFRIPSIAPTPPAALWSLPFALLVAAVSIGVLFRARVRDFGWVAVGAVVGYGGGWFGQWVLGTNLGACIGAALVALVGNGTARLRTMPAALITVPGLLVLVPGTIAFRGLRSLMEADVLTGINITTTALAVTGSIVAGLLVANVLFPAPRGL